MLLKLEAAGLTDKLAQKVVDSKGNDLAAKVVRLIQNGGFEPSTSQKEVRAIMGKNMFGIEDAIKHFGVSEPEFLTMLALFAKNSDFEPSTSQKRARNILGKNMFGIEDAIRHFGVNPSRQQLSYLSVVPFTEDQLFSSRTGGHVLVAMFPMSILDIRGEVDRRLFSHHDDAWYNKQAFAKDTGEIGWQLVGKVPIADSTNKMWNEQQALLGNDEGTPKAHVPKAQVMVYTIIGHFLACRERLFENTSVTCSDLNLNGRRVYVGYFDARGLSLDAWQDNGFNSSIGLASARKI